jgi:hypothetical protein
MINRKRRSNLWRMNKCFGSQNWVVGGAKMMYPAELGFPQIYAEGVRLDIVEGIKTDNGVFLYFHGLPSRTPSAKSAVHLRKSAGN